jgi:hypothetical protein
MPVPSTDMRLFYSGSATKATPDGNQGGTISSVAVADQDLSSTNLTLNTMWQDITFDERMNGTKKYHCFYLKNSNATATATAIRLYIDSDTLGPDKLKLGYAGTVPNTLEQALGGSSLKTKYDVPLNASEARMDDDRTRAGQTVDSFRSTLYGVAPVQIDAYLIKHGSPSDATPVKCFIKSYNFSNDSISTDNAMKASFGQVVASSIPTTSTLTTFTNTSNTYKLREDDIIWFEYESGTLTDYISVNRIGTDPVSYSHQVNYDGEQIRNVPDFDLSMKVSTAINTGGVDTIAPTGVTFSHPNTRDNAIALPDLAPGAFVGFWALLDVSARSAYFTKDKSEITIEWNS